ncbi:hypothetical protein AARAC_003922 [Aspergillus arachidicola]|uniref:Zn(2)-C6 fungal-type domain-containing protein n=1 Tax=Aspergillus arachidicola TaxID=656916 RepID=A0A2G7FVM7_9EURO|nr:hypothetical protein AARAC_003922 [Aspergillus arachidicola]
MYKPAPPRLKKTNIIRTRSGCKPCRQRRVKCDEKKPSCTACTRLGRICEIYELDFQFRHVEVSPKKPSNTCRQINDNDSRNNTFHYTETPLFSDDLIPGTAENSISLDLALRNSLMQLNQSEKEHFYIAHWEDKCARALRLLSHDLSALAHGFQPLKNSLLALSACNLSRSLPERQAIKSNGMFFKPNKDHLLYSQEHYGAAVGEIARMLHRSRMCSSPTQILATLILFCYMESVLGNFRALNCHHDGIGRFIQLHLSRLSSDGLGSNLIAAWLQSKYQGWWLRMYFSTLDFQRYQTSLSAPLEIVSVLYSPKARRAIITSIMSESHRVNTAGVLSLWKNTYGPAIDSRSSSIDDCISLLRREEKKLDEWHSQLTPLELPTESFTSLGEAHPSNGHIRPLRFHRHPFAMNYAYYVVARIMQCACFLDALQQCASSDQAVPVNDESITCWMRILLRIVAGLSKAECATRNVHTIGISNLLVACILRCSHLDIGLWIQNWLQDFLSVPILEEGSFPISQALEIVRLVNRERCSGKDVYAIGVTEEDGGGNGKYLSYQSQTIYELVLLGRMRETGCLYSESVSVEWAV